MRKGRTAWTVSWVNLMNILSAPGFCGWNMQILRENWKLCTERSPCAFLFGIGDANKIAPPARKESISGPAVQSFASSFGQPAISTAPPGTFAHSLGRLAFQTSAVGGGQTRLTGCHGDLMDWSEQISSPKTPERIAGFQRIASASARWVSFRSSFLPFSLLPSTDARSIVAHALSGKKMSRKLEVTSHHM